MLTAATFALNEEVVEPPGTESVAGIDTFALSLPSATTTPPAGAAVDNVTRQGSDSVPVTEVLPQEIPLIVGFVFGSVPVPVRLTLTLPALLDRAN